MNELACARAREQLPEHVRRGLDAVEGARLEAHLQSCAECRAEADLVRMIAQPVPVPRDLEERILEGIRTRRVPGVHRVRRYAVAAVFAFAVVTGSLLWQVVGGAGSADPPVADAPSVIAWPIGGDPLLHESGLHALSEEELVTLLQEMES